MEIKVFKTPEVPNDLWIKIAEGFNESFELNVTAEGMKNGFCTKNKNGYGYHAIALSDDGEVMGYNVFSPVYYKDGLKTVVSGSTFVRPKYRIHEMLFMNMVQALRKAVIADGFDVEIGVPNHNSEKFALKILKFNPVSELDYYILPFNISRCLNKPHLSIIDGIVQLLSNFHLFCQTGISSLFDIKERNVKYDLDYDEEFWNYRLGGGNYKKYQQGEYHAYWLPYNEDGTKAVYLMDFRKGLKRTYSALVKAVKQIQRTEDVDMILFVGLLPLKQFCLIKCPKRFIPKRLPLTYYVLNKTNREKYADMQNKKYWNFSLINFDAR